MQHCKWYVRLSVTYYMPQMLVWICETGSQKNEFHHVTFWTTSPKYHFAFQPFIHKSLIAQKPNAKKLASLSKPRLIWMRTCQFSVTCTYRISIFWLPANPSANAGTPNLNIAGRKVHADTSSASLILALITRHGLRFKVNCVTLAYHY